MNEFRSFKSFLREYLDRLGHEYTATEPRLILGEGEGEGEGEGIVVAVDPQGVADHIVWWVPSNERFERRSEGG